MKKTSIIFAIGLIIGLLIFKNYISKNSFVGKYVNNNTKPILVVPGTIPNSLDTLTLFENGEFKSKSWGKGNYEISSKYWNTEIKFSYISGWNGKSPYPIYGDYSTDITKSIFGKKKIWINSDLNYYFEKIE